MQSAAVSSLSFVDQLVAKKKQAKHVEMQPESPPLWHHLGGGNACNTVPFDQQISEEAFQDLQLKANLEYWIEPLRAVTFETMLAPISVAEARLLIRCHERQQRQQAKGGGAAAAEKEEEENAAADREALAGMEATISSCMAKLTGAARDRGGKGGETEGGGGGGGGGGRRFFVKDSCRGPKDLMLITDEFVAKYSAAVRRAAATTDDAKLAIMLAVATDELAVSTAAEAVALCVSSERVNVDMHAWLSHAKTHPMNWVVRSWHGSRWLWIWNFGVLSSVARSQRSRSITIIVSSRGWWLRKRGCRHCCLISLQRTAKPAATRSTLMGTSSTWR